MNCHYGSARLTVLDACYRIGCNIAGCQFALHDGGAVAQLGARLDGIEEAVGSNPIGSTKILPLFSLFSAKRNGPSLNATRC
jgi:hypothetical protein